MTGMCRDCLRPGVPGYWDDWLREDEMHAADGQWGDVPDVDELTEHEKRQMRAERP